MPPSAPLRTLPPAPTTTTLRMDTAAQLALAVSQFAMVIATWRGEGGAALGPVAATNLIYWASVALILLRHKLYMRHRLAILITLRTLPGLLPNARSPTVGTAVMLHRLPTPGVRGGIADLLRLSTGADGGAGGMAAQRVVQQDTLVGGLARNAVCLCVAEMPAPACCPPQASAHFPTA